MTTKQYRDTFAPKGKIIGKYMVMNPTQTIKLKEVKHG